MAGRRLQEVLALDAGAVVQGGDQFADGGRERPGVLLVTGPELRQAGRDGTAKPLVAPPL